MNVNNKLRCVGFIKPMNELPRITTIDTNVQKKHIQSFASEHGFSIEKFYCEESSDAVTEYRQLIEDAVHREFDVLIIDNIYCFGQAIFSAADFIENVIMPFGFQVFIVSDGMNFECQDFVNYLSYSRSYMRSSLAALSQKKNCEAGVKSRRTKKQTVFDAEHSLAWYEARQTEIFREMLRFPDNFEKLEEEMKFCRKAIKKLKV